MNGYQSPTSILHLVPLNGFAKKAFNDVASIIHSNRQLPIEQQSKDLQHVAKFMEFIPPTTDSTTDNSRVNDGKSRQTSIPLSETSLTSETTAITMDSPQSPSFLPKRYYDLFFDNDPYKITHGWHIGRDRWLKDDLTFVKPNGYIDLMIAPMTSPRWPDYEAHGIRATRLEYEVYVNSTLLSGRKPVGLDFKEQILALGPQTYVLRFAEVEDSVYQANLQLFASKHMKNSLPPPQSLSAPASFDINFDPWVIKRMVGEGASSQVYGAKNIHTLEAAAAKQLVRNEKTFPIIEREVSFLNRLPSSPYLLKKCATIYERGDRWLTQPEYRPSELVSSNITPEKMFIVVQPLALATLHDILDQLRREHKLHAFCQALKGLELMHAQDHPLVHRDIKLVNIGLVSWKAEGDIPGYQAPEMTRIQHNKFLDQWSVGIVGLNMFCEGLGRYPNAPSQRNHDMRLKHL
ncbi:hypothetical protein ACHAO8_011573 [Botrytis cinerea]